MRRRGSDAEVSEKRGGTLDEAASKKNNFIEQKKKAQKAVATSAAQR